MRRIAADAAEVKLPIASHTVHLPSPKAFAVHAFPTLVESVVMPFVVFYSVLMIDGFRGAILAALVWSYGASVRRVVKGQRVPGMLLLSTSLVTIRTLFAYVTGSAFVYFVQPTVTTAFVGLAFLTTAVLRRPLIERLAHDFCPLDPEIMKSDFLRRFFLRVSLLWCAVLLANAGSVMWLLLVTPVKTFVVSRTLLSSVFMVGGVVLSVVWFVKTARRNGMSVSWGGAQAIA